MMEVLVFTLNAIVIYLLADWIIREIEKRRGAVLKQRQAIFFVVFLVMALISFELLQSLLAP
ncbi:MAG: hypothetical protein OEY72_03585 [Gammaproteobacteria bacterium]|nr:hypothetical protein [Gammaproteobacteria bacterium]